MIRALFTRLIRLRNPQFAFDPALDSRSLWVLATGTGAALLRGLCHDLFRLRRPSLLMLGKGVQMQHRHRISLGRWVKLGDHTTLSGLGKGQLRIGDQSGIGAFSRVIVSTSYNHTGSHIHIGNRVGIGEFAYLGGGGGLTIGDDCIVGQYFSCHPENHIFEDRNNLIRLQGVTRKGIVVGNNCWIGSKVTLLDGVTIGEGCVIAAGAVVTQDMPANSIIAGVPAKVIRTRT